MFIRFDFIIIHDGKIVQDGRGIVEAASFDVAVEALKTELRPMIPADGRPVQLRITPHDFLIDVTPMFVVPTNRVAS